MNANVLTYVAYLGISILLTVWVARTLSKNGLVFLVEVFRDERLAQSVNHLLVVGFYLVNLGFISMALRLGYSIQDLGHSIEALSKKVGMVLMVLGAMHFLNLLVFSRMRRNATLQTTPPPVMPDAHITPGASCAS